MAQLVITAQPAYDDLQRLRFHVFQVAAVAANAAAPPLLLAAKTPLTISVVYEDFVGPATPVIVVYRYKRQPSLTDGVSGEILLRCVA